jgi:hypothetical protein
VDAGEIDSPHHIHSVYHLLKAVLSLLHSCRAFYSCYLLLHESYFQLRQLPTTTENMQFTIATIAAIAAFIAPIAAGPAASAPAGFSSLNARATLPIPASKGSVTLKAPQSVSGVFDGGMKTYGRGVSCTGQAEGGDKDAVFTIKNGGTLKNAIIGKDQIEGVHCEGSCTIEYVSILDSFLSNTNMSSGMSGGSTSVRMLSP